MIRVSCKQEFVPLNPTLGLLSDRCMGDCLQVVEVYFRKKLKKVLTPGLERCDKAVMLLRLQQLRGQMAEARKAASSLRSNLVGVNATLLVVLIILVLVAQSGVGLVA